MKNNNFQNHKKAIYGWTSVLLTVVIIALVVLGNALIYKFNWRVDMTQSKVYTVSDEADAIFKNLGGTDIEIIFFTPFDELDANRYQNMVYQYCVSLAEKYDYITLRYIDSINHPEQAREFYASEVPDVDLDDVVITTKEHAPFRKCKIEYFFNIDKDTNDVVGFYAEYRIATAIMQLTYGEGRLACFTTGHSEPALGTEISTLLEDAGFEVRAIDLSKEDIPENTRLVVINDPVYDFKGVESDVNEISKIDRYLDKYGNVMVFESPDTAANLKNLSELLSEWGIEFDRTSKIRDDFNAISADGLNLISDYTTDKTTDPGAAFSESIRSKREAPNTIIENAMPINLLFDSRNMIKTGTILTSKDTAKAFSTVDGSETGSGVMPLMTVSVKSTVASNNETYYSYVIAAGTSHFTDDKYIGGHTYGNRDIFYQCIRQFGNEEVPVDIDLRWLDENSLDVSIEQARTWTFLLITLLPCIATVVCVFVYVRRKHK